MTDNDHRSGGDSRRAFIKRGALAATALTVGAGATATVATADEEVAVLQGSDYYPDVDFDILTQLGTGTRDNFMEQFDEDEAEFGDPDDWEVYVIRIDIGESEGELAHMLIDIDNDDPDVEPGDSGTMDEIGSFRNPEQNLVETEVDL
ncbi:calcium-binding protein [Natrialbaceae archaeon AArc-T1-2]|uniref:calcium-binding protein n=1 Tax=Natrialbaceae archaeon AArc-T1-2 TaxID=3053904 RepID=UPI00255A8B3A|nr:calcium-binding protein [Natrialbaceae archaeon AArc-T1-2]WIV68471.1 calcium-binding protein [Natrialbaceae archaeon AArc-T1-2]